MITTKHLTYALVLTGALLLGGCGGGNGPAADLSTTSGGGGGGAAASNCSSSSCHGTAYSAANSPTVISNAITAASSAAIADMHISVVDTDGQLTNPAYRAFSSALRHRAQFVSTNAQCSDCHTHQRDLRSIRAAWAESAHGDPLEGWFMGQQGNNFTNFKYTGTRDGRTYQQTLNQNDVCLRCHTKTGYLDFVTSGFTDIHAWGYDFPLTDKRKEVFNCNMCHSDIAQGILRTVGRFTGYYGYSVARQRNPYQSVRATYTFKDLGASNVCVPCHTGRALTQSSAALIKVLNTFPSYTSMFVTGQASSTLIALPGHGAKTYVSNDFGYEFTGASYPVSSNAHVYMGTPAVPGSGAAGPCASCHVKMSVGGHTYIASNYSTASAKNIKRTFSDYASCTMCHGSSGLAPVSRASIPATKILRDDTVKVLLELIRNKFGVPTATGTANLNLVKRWYTSPAEMSMRSDFQGANYNATFASNGTTYIHNPLYIKQLMVDSIRMIYYKTPLSGDINAAIDSVPDARLPAVSGRSAATQKANAKAYLNIGR